MIIVQQPRDLPGYRPYTRFNFTSDNLEGKKMLQDLGEMPEKLLKESLDISNEKFHERILEDIQILWEEVFFKKCQWKAFASVVTILTE